MLKIKLTRIGKRGQPQYRIIVAEARSKRDSSFIDRLGYYNPLLKPATFDLDLVKYQTWLEKGAQPTETIRKLASHLTTSKKSKNV